MFKVQNAKTGKPVKNAIDRKPFVFETREHAQNWADNLTRDSHLNATAFNSVRPTQFIVVPA